MTQGFTFMKMDFGIELLKGVKDTAANSNFWDIGRQWTNEPMTYGGTEHQLTQIQLTDKGLEILGKSCSACKGKNGIRYSVGF